MSASGTGSPSEPSGESNQTQQQGNAETEPVAPAPQGMEEYKQPELPKILEPIYGLLRRIVGPRWAPPIWIFLVVVCSLFSGLLTMAWSLALWDSYRPKITISAGPTLDSRNPLATSFIVENQGALPIRNIEFSFTWVSIDDPIQVRNFSQGFKEIPELAQHEDHALINVLSQQEASNAVQATVTPFAAPIEHHSLVLWYDVTYEPRFFGKRKETLYFFGTWDVQGNFQWIPTGHTDIRGQQMDPGLLKRSLDIKDGILKQLKTSQTTSSNGVNNVHTN